MYYAIPGRNRRWRDFYGQFIRPGDLCFDVGAHVGNRTGALVSIGARVVAVEPQRICQPILRRLYGRNPNIILLYKALGAKVGEGELLVSKAHSTVSSLSGDWVEQVAASAGFSQVSWDGVEKVEITTLDTLIETYGMPRYCKLDVEGYEYQVFLGLSQAIPFMSFEYIPVAMQVAFVTGLEVGFVPTLTLQTKLGRRQLLLQ